VSTTEPTPAWTPGDTPPSTWLPTPPPPAAPEPPKGGKPWWKRWWAIALAALLLMGIGAAIANPASSSQKSASSTTVPDRYPATPEGNQPNTTWPSYSSPPPATTQPTPEETTPEPAGPVALKYGAEAIAGSSGESFGMASFKVAAPVPLLADDLWTPDNGRFVTVDVTVAGLSGAAHFNPLQFKIQTADGRVWQSGMGIKEPALNYGDIAKGQTVRGWVTFDISTSPVKSVQLYSGGFGGEMLASWTS